MKTWDLGIENNSNTIGTFEPDLRKEFSTILNGNMTEGPRGHWIIFRKSNLSKRSIYWNAERQESIGGPPFEFNDYLIRARYRSFITGQEEYRDEIGLIERPIKAYYIDFKLRPKKEDYIIEIEQSDDETNQVPTVFTVRSVYDILLVDEPRDNAGRVEYCVCMCKEQVSRGDSTLENIRITEKL